MSDVLERLLDGAVDLHVHPYPSPFPRRMDASEAAQRAADAGMRAIVVKSHHHDTAMDVAALREHGIASSGIEVYGGIVDALVEAGGPHPSPDVQAPLLSLPRLLGTTAEGIPAPVPYLFADPAHIAAARSITGAQG